jgi:molybdate transport system permease protein
VEEHLERAPQAAHSSFFPSETGEGRKCSCEDAASSLGANKLLVFATVTLPLALPGILAGIVLAFAKALGEFGATITFVSNIPGETRTLPVAIYTFTQVPGGDAGAMRLALVAIALSLGALIVSELLARRLAARIAG